MSEKTAKAKKSRAAAKKDNAGVLGSLPATRTTRFGGERAERSGSAAKPAATATKATAAPAKPKAKAKPKTPAKAKAPAPRSAEVTTTERARRTPATPAGEPAAPRRPRPVRAGAPALAESTERARADASEPLEPGASPPTGTELVTTAIQAAGELAQIGLTVGGQVLKRALRRPR
jgi:hypothetical protein